MANARASASQRAIIAELADELHWDETRLQAFGATIPRPVIWPLEMWDDAKRLINGLRRELRHRDELQRLCASYEIHEAAGIAAIPLGGDAYPGRYAIVDLADLPKVAGCAWVCRRAGTHRDVFYAYGHVPGRKNMTLMHRYILDLPLSKPLVDHKNFDGLDNRRSNLRTATPVQSQWNLRPITGGTSPYKGVSWNTKQQRWVVWIKNDGKLKYLGSYTDEEQAARAYDAAALELRGEFAYLNFPDEMEIA